MRSRLRALLILLLFAGHWNRSASPAQQNNAPHLEKRGAATQLIVDGQPFLILGGEILNSSSSSLELHEAHLAQAGRHEPQHRRHPAELGAD